VKRNHDFGPALACEFDRLTFPYNLGTTHQIAHWAYETTANSAGLTWMMKQDWCPSLGNGGNFSHARC
jgi:hypothetical protein